MKTLEKLLPKQPISRFEQEVLDRDEIQQSVIQCVFMAHQVVATCYEGIPAGRPADRKTVRDYVNQNSVKQVETAIDAVLSIAMDKTRAMEEREVAAGRVKEGMAYWQGLIMRRIEAAA
jgi:hypothetical protein